jgi:tRNA threonylcarbamoyladenosine modification (KEOPS) complex  Pcc1 subunit
MVMRIKCKIPFPNRRYLETVFKALKPETTKSSTMRSRAFLEKDDTFLILKIEAKDTVALRAAVNAYLRWMDSIRNVLGVLERL